MSDKYIIDEEGEYVIDTETNDLWDATGGGDGIYMLVKKVNKLLKENKQLKEELDSFEQVSFTDMCDGSSTILYMKKENVGDSDD